MVRSVYVAAVARCSQCNIEVAALVDASDISSTDWQNVLNFLNSIAANYNINSNCVRMAVILYSERTTVVSFQLNRYGDISSLQQGIRSLRVQGGASANFLTALRQMRNQVFASNIVRPGASRLAFIVSDQLACNSQIVAEANNAKATGISIVGVAVTWRGSQLVTSCMRQVVTPNQYIEVPAYNQLGNYVNRAMQYLCPARASKFVARVNDPTEFIS